jgi:D-glucosaminate-6-phosphate ammonia-lyase
MTKKPGRRGFLKTTMALGVSAAGPTGVHAAAASRLLGDNIYTRIGVRPLINGVRTVTVLGGCIMPAEVTRAMEEAGKYFVSVPELQKKAGARIADLLGVPAAMVTAGAASAMTVGVAACVTGGDKEKLRRLPDTSGMKNEIIQQKSHIDGYQAQMLQAGTKIVWVETREELDAAISERTAMMFFLAKHDPIGRIHSDEWIRVGKARGMPTFCDAAANLPPVENLWAYVKQGFDLVTFSGGKGLLGPQCSGLLLGRKDLVEAGQQALSPYSGIGRGMKVGKEEIMGLLAAVERYLKVDHEAEKRELESRAAEMIESLAKVSGLTVKKYMPEVDNHTPHVQIDWDEKTRKLTSKDVVQQLLDGDPPIAVQRPGGGRLLVSVWMMRPGEHRVVIKRLREIFNKA